MAEAWGLDFRHHHGGSGERYMVETMVGGLVLFDYDGDGDDDAFFVDGAKLPGYQGEEPKSRLFRNDTTASGEPRFVEVTQRAGIDFSGYGCGGSAADYDGDGDVDLYLTAFGRNALLQNQGDGTFRDVAPAAGVDDALWSASSAWADVDLDGDLDLYVASYVDFTLDNHKFCGNREKQVRGYCHPDKYEGLPDRLFLNQGDGSFVESAEAAGLAAAREAGLGVVFGDLNDDGAPDLYVANDLDPNLLFINRGDGTFDDESLLSGTAFGVHGRPEAGMGVDIADFDGDGRADIVVTNFALETNALYRNSGFGTFVDRRFADNLAEKTLTQLGFGVAATDVDLDGDPDLLFANGHILDNPEELGAESAYAQQNQLMENIGGGRFREVEDAGLREIRVSRGLAVSDLDLDGDVDVVIVNSNQPAEAYRNDGGVGRWLQVDLRQSGPNREAVGAKLTVETGSRRQVSERRTGSSYLSQSSGRLSFGLADSDRATLEVRWPSGQRARFEGLEADHRVRVER